MFSNTFCEITETPLINSSTCFTTDQEDQRLVEGTEESHVEASHRVEEMAYRLVETRLGQVAGMGMACLEVVPQPCWVEGKACRPVASVLLGPAVRPVACLEEGKASEACSVQDLRDP